MFVGVNSRRRLGHPGGRGRSGAGTNFGWDIFKTQTSAASRPSVTTTSATELRVALPLAFPGLGSVKFDSGEDIPIDAFQGNASADHFHR